jgi:hypothetical protein
MSNLHRDTEDEYSLSNIVVGTELNMIYIMDDLC